MHDFTHRSLSESLFATGVTVPRVASCEKYCFPLFRIRKRGATTTKPRVTAAPVALSGTALLAALLPKMASDILTVYCVDPSTHAASDCPHGSASIRRISELNQPSVPGRFSPVWLPFGQQGFQCQPPPLALSNRAELWHRQCRKSLNRIAELRFSISFALVTGKHQHTAGLCAFHTNPC